MVTSKPAPKRKPAKRPAITDADRIAAIGRRIPRSVRAMFPKDGARNLDHYLYGARRQED
jgi:hypothetical protein